VTSVNCIRVNVSHMTALKSSQ